MNLNKIKNIFNKIILIILFLAILYITYCSIFNIYISRVVERLDLKPLVIVLGVIVLIFLFIKLKKIFHKVKEEKSNLIAIIITIGFFGLLCLAGYVMTSIPTYDLPDVQREALWMLQNNGEFTNNTYFSMYTNQIPLTILVYYIYKIATIFNIGNLNLFAMVINSFFIAITAFFTYLSVKKIENHKLALATLLFFVINPIFYISASYFYSDTLCMPFSAIAIYMFISAIKSENIKKRISLWILGGIILAIGFKIRVVIGIIIIAILIGLVLRNKIKKCYTDIIFIIIGFLIGIALCTLIENRANPKIDENLKFPVTHWIMMGMNAKSNGMYTANDLYYTRSFETYSEKIDKNLSMIKKRISQLGINGMIDLLKTKLSVSWSYGGYDYIDKLSNVEHINAVYEYISGNKKIFFIYFMQICKTTILVVYLFSIAKEYRSSNKKYTILNIAVFGALLFYELWESKDRYSLSFLPWMIISFGCGINEIEKLLHIRKIKFESYNSKNKVIDFQKLIKNCVRTIFILSICLLSINYYEYAIKKDIKEDMRVVQYRSNKMLKLKVSDNVIRQTFKADKKFNSISILINKEGITSKTNYKFVLKNKNEEILYEETFTSDSVSDNSFKNFKFKTIKPEGKQEYIMEITSEDATDENTIVIATYYLENHSAYPEGVLNINGTDSEADITFRVKDKVKRSYLSKKVYILLSLIIISIEIFAFYPYLKCTRKNKEKIKA